MVVLIGGAGGVGSIAIQLVRALTDVTVIATAARAWSTTRGRSPRVARRADQGTRARLSGLRLLHQRFRGARPAAGPVGLIDNPDGLDIASFRQKAVSIHWEPMFTRPTYETPDMGEQGKLLSDVARMADQGAIRSTVTDVLRPIKAANLKTAHAKLESGKTIGKIVLEGF